MKCNPAAPSTASELDIVAKKKAIKARYEKEME
jgi:hypothetical protein